MSVMMGLRITADPAQVQEALKSDPERLEAVTERPTPVFWRELDTPDKF